MSCKTPEPHNDSTWAARNPQKDIIPSRNREKLTETEKATRKLGQEQARLKKSLLTADVDAYIAERDATIEQLAAKHSQKSDYIKSLVNNSSGFKNKREPALHNALAHFKAVEVNKGMCLHFTPWIT
jgi:hypothetical protein